MTRSVPFVGVQRLIKRLRRDSEYPGTALLVLRTLIIFTAFMTQTLYIHHGLWSHKASELTAQDEVFKQVA